MSIPVLPLTDNIQKPAHEFASSYTTKVSSRRSYAADRQSVKRDYSGLRVTIARTVMQITNTLVSVEWNTKNCECRVMLDQCLTTHTSAWAASPKSTAYSWHTAWPRLQISCSEIYRKDRTGYGGNVHCAIQKDVIIKNEVEYCPVA